MRSKDKIVLITLVFFAQLFLSGRVNAEPTPIGANASPVSVPESDRVTLVSFFPVIFEGKVVGGLAVYDDGTTERAADYLELYNSERDLLAVTWFDNYGIQRMAVDRGVLEEADELEGVFIVLLDGDSI